MAAAQLAAETPVEIRQSLAAVVVENKHWEVEVDSQFRSSRMKGPIYQYRVGMEWARHLAPRWSLVGAYRMRHRRRDVEAFIPTVHRFNIGVERDFHLGAVKLTSRTLAERWLRPGSPDNNRYRQRLYFSYPRRYTPFSAVEVFADHRGLSILRWASGVAWRQTPSWKMQLWYAYDHRPAHRSHSRHVITTLGRTVPEMNLPGPSAILNASPPERIPFQHESRYPSRLYGHERHLRLRHHVQNALDAQG